MGVLVLFADAFGVVDELAIGVMGGVACLEVDIISIKSY